MKIEFELTKLELEDLKTIVDIVYDSFDFHGDSTDMKKSLDILSKAINEK